MTELFVMAPATAPPDTTPDPFSFTDQTGAALGSVVTSNILAITGITGNVATSVSSGGSYRVCADATCSANPAFTTSAGVMSNGQYLQLRLTASGSPGVAVNTTITVGTGSDNWSVTSTGTQDTTPDVFTFTDQTNVGVSTQIVSNILAITGITGNVATSIAGGSAAYRICTNATCSTNPAFTTAASTITNGQYLQLRMTSSSSISTAVNTTMTVGTVSDNWSLTTASVDNSPDQFAFANQSGIAPGTQVVSNVVQVTGIAGNVAVSVSGGDGQAYRVCPTSSCSGSFTSSASTITNGQYLQLRQDAAAGNGATVTTTATVGTFAANWSVTTVNDPCAGSPSAGTTCADGSKFAGYSPANGGKMYATPADYPGDQQFAWPEQLWGQTSGVDGEANTNGLAQFNNYQAANACYYLTAHGKSDWYLPSPAEWNVIDPNRDAIGGFQPDGDQYWTSAEEEGDGWFGGIYHVIGSTFNGYTGQGIGFPIRCVRKD